MRELRKDPVVGRWVIISTERADRPVDFGFHAPVPREKGCPFCPGREKETPPEILALGRNGAGPDDAGWKVRVVPNKFPALQIEGELDRRGEGMFDKMNGIGAHEVIIETPDHAAQWWDLDADHLVEVLRAYRARMLDLARDPRFKYILVFKNQGEAAGATLEHPHTQLIATPIIPTWVKEELTGARDHYRLKERCIYCDIIRQEIDEAKRLVTATDQFVVFEPFAPRFPYETWIMPRRHASSFEGGPEDQLVPLAGMLRDVFVRLHGVLGTPPYNMVIHTAPVGDPFLLHFHWHIEIMPKIVHAAGFEWGSGFHINVVPPEDASRRLREAGTPV
jgi:UDPglucose--hexose-1-phosphate uridylyltransferase